MKKFFYALRRLPSPVRWFHRASRGSVLILVVALIVILALLGTAFISTARIDRYNATASITTTAIAQEIPEVTTKVEQAIVSQMFDASGNYRPLVNDPTTSGLSTYGNFDTNRDAPSPETQEWDIWMADRAPVLDSNPQAEVEWRVVSRLPNTTFTNIQLPTGTNTITYDPFGKTTLTSVYLVPTAISLTYPRSTSENPPNTPKVFPAFYMMNAANGLPLMTDGVTPSTTGLPVPFIAADADGDGIADSLLFSLNLTTPSGSGPISYYAAVRIVDNNSAVNINTAWSRYGDFAVATAPGNITAPETGPSYVDAIGNPVAGPAGADNLGWFPSHVGLLEMLDPQVAAGPGFPAPSLGAASSNVEPPSAGAEMANLNGFRFNTTLAITNMPTDFAPHASTARIDYNFVTIGDALYMELGRRLGNPGVNIPNTSKTYRAVSDNGELGFRFNMVDPNSNSSPAFSYVTAPTTAEQYLPRSAYQDAINWVNDWTDNRWSLYPADKSVYWYDYNFNTFDSAAAAAIDASRDNDSGPFPSNVNGLTPVFYRNLRTFAVTHNPLSNAAPIHTTVANTRTVPVTAPASPPAPTASYMAAYPAAPAIPIKASINTDSFPILWLAFWNVMCDESTATSISPPPLAPPLLFDPTQVGGTWKPTQHLLLRAALAAVNAENLREPVDITGTGTNTVISHHLLLPDPAGVGTQVDVEVFGNAPQLYIATYTPGPAGSKTATISFFNPRQTQITLNHCVVVYQNTANSVLTWLSDTVQTVPGVTQSATPVTLNFPPATLDAMGNILPGKILLMRTRSPIAGATGFTSATGVDTYTENDSNPGEFVPLDMVTDATTAIDRTPYNWTDVTTKVGGAGQSVQLFNDDFPGPMSSPTDITTPPKFPYGTFARVGDIMQVPFIGSYRVNTGTPRSPIYLFVPITLDCSTCTTGTAGEQIGRFCPTCADPLSAVTPATDPYGFALRLFDYFTTIQNPNNDYSPNISPANWVNPATGVALTPAPTPIANTTGVTGNNINTTENNDGVDGLININTAPWQVLAALPMVPAGTNVTPKGADDNVKLAKLIVQWRDGDTTHPAHGPFKSIFELNRVTDGTNTFQNAYGSLPTGTNPGVAQGDFTPISGGPDTVPTDFEDKFLTLNRISNLITTRSDTFTCYIVVQAWLNVGVVGTNPQMIAQQRVGFIVDRHAVGSNSAAAAQVTNINYTSQ